MAVLPGDPRLLVMPVANGQTGQQTNRGGSGKGLGVLIVRQALPTITPHWFATPFAHLLPSSPVPLQYCTPYLASWLSSLTAWHLKMKLIWSFEREGTSDPTILHRIPESWIFHHCRTENLHVTNITTLLYNKILLLPYLELIYLSHLTVNICSITPDILYNMASETTTRQYYHKNITQQTADHNAAPFTWSEKSVLLYARFQGNYPKFKKKKLFQRA